MVTHLYALPLYGHLGAIALRTHVEAPLIFAHTNPRPAARASQTPACQAPGHYNHQYEQARLQLTSLAATEIVTG